MDKHLGANISFVDLKENASKGGGTWRRGLGSKRRVISLSRPRMVTALP